MFFFHRPSETVVLVPPTAGRSSVVPARRAVFLTKWSSLCLLVVLMVTASCSGPEQKKMKFYNRGNALYEKGDYVKAELEFKNAAQIDPKFTDAY